MISIDELNLLFFTMSKKYMTSLNDINIICNNNNVILHIMFVINFITDMYLFNNYNPM